MPTVTFAPATRTESPHSPSLSPSSEAAEKFAEFADRFEEKKSKKKPKEKAPAAIDIICNANQVLDRLLNRIKHLNDSILQKRNEISSNLNSRDDLVSIALHYCGKDLVEMLIDFENTSSQNPSLEMTNERFLLQCFKALYEIESTSVADWLKLTLNNSPDGNQFYNLFALYKDFLQQGNRIYDKIKDCTTEKDYLTAKHQGCLAETTRLQALKELASEACDTAKKEQAKTDKKIAKLKKNQKNQNEINLSTKYYLLQANRLEENTKAIDAYEEKLHAIDEELPTLLSQIAALDTKASDLKKQSCIYEKKLALLEVLLGYDFNQEGDPQRVQLIQRAITNEFKKFEDYKTKSEIHTDMLFNYQVKLQEKLKEYETANAFEKYFLRIDIKRIAKYAEEALVLIANTSPT